MRDGEGVSAGSVWGHRTVVPVPDFDRRRHRCGCGNKRTHVGLGDGVALMDGCEMCVRRWVRDGVNASHSAVV